MKKILGPSVLFTILFGFLSIAYALENITPSPQYRILGPISSPAQETISPEDAAKYIGQQKTVCGKVASAHYAAIISNQPTSLHLDKPYPHQIFTILIWGSDRSKSEKPRETLYFGKEICVTGMIQSYRGRPEIVVKEPGQIKVK